MSIAVLMSLFALLFHSLLLASAKESSTPAPDSALPLSSSGQLPPSSSQTTATPGELKPTPTAIRSPFAPWRSHQRPRLRCDQVTVPPGYMLVASWSQQNAPWCRSLADCDDWALWPLDSCVHHYAFSGDCRFKYRHLFGINCPAETAPFHEDCVGTEAWGVRPAEPSATPWPADDATNLSTPTPVGSAPRLSPQQHSLRAGAVSALSMGAMVGAAGGAGVDAAEVLLCIRSDMSTRSE
eukprot:TRINITY_DN36777_c0_g1_i1.p1 TRINITY_DN36777_c0_g1~~TRINITY_DN36777_c0_g1_i1.p1  ORF type:complete len:239 (+),score=9.12 TRINITY_DN36777_c0_g1_i1:217-933(+)